MSLFALADSIGLQAGAMEGRTDISQVDYSNTQSVTTMATKLSIDGMKLQAKNKGLDEVIKAGTTPMR